MQLPDELGSQWPGWISSSATHNYVQRDPLVDFFNAYGESIGFVPDQERSGYDHQFDYVSRRQSWAFEKKVVPYLSTGFGLRVIAANPSQARLPPTLPRKACEVGSGSVCRAVTYGFSSVMVRWPSL